MVDNPTMPRSARLDAPGVMHHVMGRGIEKRKIFLDDRDRMDFLRRLGELAKADGMEVYAFALLPNHFHLLCKTKNRPLSSSMRKLLTGYAVRFNRRHRRHGHLFQNRYKSIVCQEEAYLAELVRYIHLNLLRAGIVKNIQELNRCPWSGHSALVGEAEGREWQERNYVLSYFGGERKGLRNYLRFVKEGVSLGRRPELVGGGLVRSLGGWSGVRALRGRGKGQAFDERILGDGDFVKEVLAGESGERLFGGGQKKGGFIVLGGESLPGAWGKFGRVSVRESEAGGGGGAGRVIADCGAGAWVFRGGSGAICGGYEFVYYAPAIFPGEKVKQIPVGDVKLNV